MSKIVYCDGSCLGNPGPGGWAFLLTDELKIHSGSEPQTTNNRMELLAACKAIQYAGNCTIHTDSRYLTLGISEWLPKWKANGWRTASRTAVKNVDLWELLDALINKYQIRWQWVKGHDIQNKIHNSVDQEARKAAMLCQ